MKTTEERLEYALSALKAIAAMLECAGGGAHKPADLGRIAEVAVAVARVTIDKIAVKTTDTWPAGREKEAAAYNRQYGPR